MWRDSPPPTSHPSPSLPPSLPRPCDFHSLSDRPRTCCQSCLFTCPLVVESLELSWSLEPLPPPHVLFFCSPGCSACWEPDATNPSCRRSRELTAYFAFNLIFCYVTQALSLCFVVIQEPVSCLSNSKSTRESLWRARTLTPPLKINTAALCL